ncbi:hypothetical protein LTR97_011538 [Elasticomyces elasticus]|uniref:Yeast cell wall synthesis Kre9/Knh1-like N-terminal domain-containing protein n=1 Tax=Elasticomyces elasticus TaxID=574655 RepID=A0AAN7W0I8_9PEZI|nr:hypothetical protein LTR97_011538 [Elasticomyces elasticus]
MLFTRSLILLAAPFLAYAQSAANPFNVPNGGYSVTAGSPTDLTWKPTTSGTVTLILRSGPSSNLIAGTVIASSIDNSGSYTWTPDTSITRGSDYTVQIVSDDDSSQTNFTPYFVLDSDTVVAYSTNPVTLGASAPPTSALSTLSPTGSATSVTAALSSASASVSSASASASSVSASDSSAASSSSMATGSSSSGSSAAAATTSGSSASQTQSTMSTGTMSGTSSGAASASSAASSSAAPEQQSSAGAPRATALAGMLGFAALGVFAL